MLLISGTDTTVITKQVGESEIRQYGGGAAVRIIWLTTSPIAGMCLSSKRVTNADADDLCGIVISLSAVQLGLLRILGCSPNE